MEALTRMAQQANSDVIASAAAGDELAFRRIIAEHHEDMRRVCAYVTRDDAVADEAAYAAWAIAWTKIGSVREPASLRPWLTAVAVNEAKRLLRKRKRRAEIEVRADASGEPGGVDLRPASHRSTCEPQWNASTQMTAPSSPCVTWLASTPANSQSRPGSPRLPLVNA